MEALRSYLNSLPTEEQDDFARRCDTSIGYLRKTLSTKGKLGESIAIAIERESNGAVRCEDVRPDVDWAYLRGTSRNKKAARLSAAQ